MPTTRFVGIPLSLDILDVALLIVIVCAQAAVWFYRLPSELNLLVLSHLGASDLVSLALVSHLFHMVIPPSTARTLDGLLSFLTGRG